MDENKEFMTSENTAETEQTEESKTANAKASEQDNYSSVFSDELAELEEYTAFKQDDNVDNLKPEKKKHFIQLPVIISIIIVAGVALGFIVFKCFFNTSIIGTWAIEDTTESGATADEVSDAKTYYVFEDDGVLTLTYGTMKYVGTYTQSDGMVTMEIKSANLYASFKYSVKGNVFTGRTLTFDDTTYDTQYTFHSASIKVPDLKVDEDFKPNDKLTGEWNYYDGIYDFVYKFNSNGTVSIIQNQMLYVEGVYSCTDDIITIKYYADSEQTLDFEYIVDDNTLTINGLQYLRVGSASADEARQAISNMTE